MSRSFYLWLLLGMIPDGIYYASFEILVAECTGCLAVAKFLSFATLEWEICIADRYQRSLDAYREYEWRQGLTSVPSDVKYNT